MMMMVFGRRREERKAKRSTLKEVLDLLGSSEVDGLLAFIVLDLGVSSMGQQDLDDLNMSFLASHHQGGLSFVLEIEITSQTNQTINNRSMTVEQAHIKAVHPCLSGG
jgi:hypothetical protein